MKHTYKREQNFTHIGPGGMNCACCGPPPGKKRKAYIRSRKRAERQKLNESLLKTIEDGKDND